MLQVHVNQWSIPSQTLGGSLCSIGLNFQIPAPRARVAKQLCCTKSGGCGPLWTREGFNACRQDWYVDVDVRMHRITLGPLDLDWAGCSTRIWYMVKQHCHIKHYIYIHTYSYIDIMYTYCILYYFILFILIHMLLYFHIHIDIDMQTDRDPVAAGHSMLPWQHSWVVSLLQICHWQWALGALVYLCPWCSLRWPSVDMCPLLCRSKNMFSPWAATATVLQNKSFKPFLILLVLVRHLWLYKRFFGACI
jgi:hypothetical protein